MDITILWSLIIGVLAILVTVLIGWQIHQIINIDNFKKEFSSKNASIDGKLEEIRNKISAQSYGVMSHIVRDDRFLPLYLYFSFSQMLAYSKMMNGERLVERGYSRVHKFLKQKNLELCNYDKTVLLDILLQINVLARHASGNQAMIKTISNAQLSDNPPMLAGIEDGDFSWYEDNL